MKLVLSLPPLTTTLASRFSASKSASDLRALHSAFKMVPGMSLI